MYPDYEIWIYFPNGDFAIAPNQYYREAVAFANRFRHAFPRIVVQRMKING